jgi:hypothetical protein
VRETAGELANGNQAHRDRCGTGAVADFKTHARITFTDDDNVPRNLLKAARRAIEKYTGLSIVTKTITVQVNNQAGGFELPYGPVISVTTVKDVDGGALDYTTSGLEFKTLTNAYSFAEIQYDAGLGTVPEDLKLAIMKQAMWDYEHRGDEAGEGRVM